MLTLSYLQIKPRNEYVIPAVRYHTSLNDFDSFRVKDLWSISASEIDVESNKKLSFYIDKEMFVHCNLYECEMWMSRINYQLIELYKRKDPFTTWTYVTFYYLSFYCLQALSRIFYTGYCNLDQRASEALNKISQDEGNLIKIKPGYYYYKCSAFDNDTLKVDLQLAGQNKHEFAWDCLSNDLFPKIETYSNQLDLQERSLITFYKQIDANISFKDLSRMRNELNYPAEVSFCDKNCTFGTVDINKIATQLPDMILDGFKPPINEIEKMSLRISIGLFLLSYSKLLFSEYCERVDRGAELYLESQSQLNSSNIHIPPLFNNLYLK